MYKEFLEKRNEWMECLSGKDRNCIEQQLHSLIWNTAAYEIINEARKHAPPAQEGGVQLNGLMHNLIDRCFHDSQLIAIRRLIYGDNSKGKRGVYSLKALLEEMKKNSKLITRGNIFKSEDLEYDHQKLQVKEEEYIREHLSKGQKSVWVPQKYDSGYGRRRHRSFDILSGKSENERDWGDQIKPEIFDLMIKQLGNVSTKAKAISDKFIAHAATKESRNFVDPEHLKICRNDIWPVLETMCGVTNNVKGIISNGRWSTFLAIPSYDQFIYIDEPLIDKSKIQVLKDKWDEFGKKVNQWCSNTLFDLAEDSIIEIQQHMYE